MTTYSNQPRYQMGLEKLVNHRSYRTASDGDHTSGSAKRPNRARRLTAEQIDELVEAYKAGSTTKELGERFKIHKTTVGKHLRARGVDTTPPSIALEDIPKIVWLYEKQHWSTERIANKFNASARSVRSRLLEAGVKMRDTHGRNK